MSTQAWIFTIGLRVIDVGALIVWLVWFFRLRDEPDDDEDPGWGDGPAPEPSSSGPSGDGLDFPLLPRSSPWSFRLRDHVGPQRPAVPASRPARLVPSRRQGSGCRSPRSSAPARCSAA